MPCVFIKHRDYRQYIPVFLENVAGRPSPVSCRLPPEYTSAKIARCFKHNPVNLIKKLFLPLGSFREGSRFHPVFGRGGEISHFNQDYWLIISLCHKDHILTQ